MMKDQHVDVPRLLLLWLLVLLTGTTLAAAIPIKMPFHYRMKVNTTVGPSIEDGLQIFKRQALITLNYRFADVAGVHELTEYDLQTTYPTGGTYETNGSVGYVSS